MIADVVIVGGGMAGLAAAVRLAHDGASVAIFDQAPGLGGRCYSFRDAISGDIVDNGQHVLLSAYTATLRYLELIGTAPLLTRNRFDELSVHHPSWGRLSFDLRPSFPFSVPKGLFHSTLLKPIDRLKSAAIGMEFLRWSPALEQKLRSMTIAEWLISHGQSGESCRNFWYPLATAVMNDLPETASAFPFVHALKLAFADQKGGASVLIPSVGQTELYVDEAVGYIRSRRGMIFENTGVLHILEENTKAVGISLRNGDTIHAGSVICAVPQYSLNELLPPNLASCEPYRAANAIAASPIVSVHLWFERSFMDAPMLGVIDGTAQWLFDRSAIMNRLGREAATLRGYCSATISAARDVVDLQREEIVKRVVEDIHTIYPADKTRKLLHNVVIKEKRATYSSTPGTERLRPQTRTPISGLFLAGDWTDTGLPPTIEGAVRSGFAAADAVALR